mmetsp:Transcript_13955/g.60884  ORF Transcript_13955/g.60884 Transcript_13955/m.60884 type:complete len:318 (+) Transcript_13955:298-1251(+)
MSPPDARHAVGQMLPVFACPGCRTFIQPPPGVAMFACPRCQTTMQLFQPPPPPVMLPAPLNPWAQPGPSPEGIPSGLVTEGSTLNQRFPAVELAPNVFYAPPSGYADYTSRENEQSGWLGIFEETVPPPFGRAVDPGVQYVKVKVLCAGTTELCRDDDGGAWLRFRVPTEIFPPEFIADVGPMNHLDLYSITTLSFQLPHCENYLDATFITPVDIRRVIGDYQNLSMNQSCWDVLDCFCCGCLTLIRKSQQKPDYGLGPAPAREPPPNTVGGGCGAACGAGGANMWPKQLTPSYWDSFQHDNSGGGCGGGDWTSCGG